MGTSNEATKVMFVQRLGMDLRSATIFVDNGYSCLEEVAYVPFSELAAIEGLQETEVQAWQLRAREILIHGVTDDGEDGESQATVVPKPQNLLVGGTIAPIDTN